MIVGGCYCMIFARNVIFMVNLGAGRNGGYEEFNEVSVSFGLIFIILVCL